MCARVCVYHHHCLNTLAYTNICSTLTSPYTSLPHPPPTLTPENSIADQGAENAVEYVTVNPDGTYLVTHDDTMGMGYTLLASDTSAKSETDKKPNSIKSKGTELDACVFVYMYVYAFMYAYAFMYEYMMYICVCILLTQLRTLRTPFHPPSW